MSSDPVTVKGAQHDAEEMDNDAPAPSSLNDEPSRVIVSPEDSNKKSSKSQDDAVPEVEEKEEEASKNEDTVATSKGTTAASADAETSSSETKDEREPSKEANHDEDEEKPSESPKGSNDKDPVATSKDNTAVSADAETSSTEAKDEREPPSKVGNNDEKKSTESPKEANDKDGNASTTTSGKKRDGKTLPPRPVKRARTAYFIFTDEKRPQVQAEHPGEGVAVVARVMGQMWNSMPAEEKEQYQQRAAQERERVAKALEEWKAAGGVIESDPNGGGSSKDPSALVFPLARMRKICKLDPEVRGVSKEGMLLITKCAELFTAKIGKESVRVAQLQNRRKLLPDDVASVCTHRDQFTFLKEDIRDLVKALPSASESKTTTKKMGSAMESAAAGSKPLTSYFGVSSSSKNKKSKA